MMLSSSSLGGEVCPHRLPPAAAPALRPLLVAPHQVAHIVARAAELGQHATTFTPPPEAGLLVEFVQVEAGSAHRFDHRSSVTRCRRADKARREASIAFTAPTALRSSTAPGRAGDRIAGEAEIMLHADLGGIIDLAGRAAERRRQTAAAIEQATPTSPWQPTSAPEIEASLNSEPTGGGQEEDAHAPRPSRAA